MARKSKPTKANKKRIAFAAGAFQQKPAPENLQRLLELVPKPKHPPMF